MAETRILKNMKTTLWLLSVLAVLFSTLAVKAETKLKAGDAAPKITGKDAHGKDWKLTEFKNRKAVLLYFYPKDDTPGCTKEACGLRDRMEYLKKDQVEVVGVSFDSGESHQKFIEKYKLNFTLLADTDGKIAEVFGVKMPDKNMARRVSFLIDQKGKIAHITDNSKADVHLEEMKAAVAALTKKP